MNLPGFNGRRWHYRRSLASRVTLLTTMAVGLAVAFVAFGTYMTARVQMQDSLDESLLDRAQAAAGSGVIPKMFTNEYNFSSAALGAGDIRIIYINTDGRALSVDHGPDLDLGYPEREVLLRNADHAIRTI